MTKIEVPNPITPRYVELLKAMSDSGRVTNLKTLYSQHGLKQPRRLDSIMDKVKPEKKPEATK